MSVRGPRVTKKLIDQETHDITNFMFAKVHPQEGSVVFTQELFVAYTMWRKRQGLKATELSLLSFGRLFFAYFERKTRVVYRDGEIGRGLENYKVSQ